LASSNYRIENPASIGALFSARDDALALLFVGSGRSSAVLQHNDPVMHYRLGICADGTRGALQGDRVVGAALKDGLSGEPSKEARARVAALKN